VELSLGIWKIRSWQPEDEPALVKYANNRNVWINLRDSFPYPYTSDDARSWLRSVRKQNPETAFAIASPDEALGGIGLHLNRDVFKRSAELGYWLGEPFWNRGIATRAVVEFTKYAFANFDLVRMYAGVFEWNIASMRVLEKAGYTMEARHRKTVIKDGKIIDQIIYVTFRDEFTEQ
jgi:ribosomal-protein-alanine N-acetyltransferase